MTEQHKDEKPGHPPGYPTGHPTGHPAGHPADSTFTLSIPIQIKTRSGRKQIIAPDGKDLLLKDEAAPKKGFFPAGPSSDPIPLAIARAHRWLELIESGKFRNGPDLARALRIDPSYVTRLLHVTLLRPDIISALLNNTCPSGLAIKHFQVHSIPEVWADQKIPG